MTPTTSRSSTLPVRPARILAPACLVLAIVVLTLVLLSGGGSPSAGTAAPSGWGADQTASAR
jgi:hypothetical protein